MRSWAVEQFGNRKLHANKSKQPNKSIMKIIALSYPGEYTDKKGSRKICFTGQPI